MGEKEPHMSIALRSALAGASLVIVAFAGCAPAETGSAPPAETTASTSPTASDTPAEPALATAESPLGPIVVNQDGMSVYVFDKDTPNSGTSVCEGDCLVKWPAVTVTDDSPQVDGVTGTVDTITRSDGSLQVTLNGWPLYLYAGDMAGGDVTGQAVGGVWWVVSPGGDKITATPSAP
jgi:predicted lipoprotein with Yx(FWY)xxD motif